MKDLSSTGRALFGTRRNAVEIAWTLLARGSGAPLALMANIGLARLLGASQFGRYATLLSTGLVAGGIAIYGTAPVLTREIAAQAPERRREAFRRVTGWACTVIVPLVVLVTALVIVWLGWGAGAPVSDWQERLAVIFLIPLSGLAILLNSILAGLSRVAQGQLLGNGWRNGWLLAGVAVLLVIGDSQLADALWIQVISYLFLTALGLWFIRRALDRVFEAALPTVREAPQVRYKRREWWRSAAAFFGFSLGTMLFVRLDVIVVNALAGNTQAGYFGAAARLVQVVQLPGLVWLAWLQPKLARETSRKAWGEVRKTYLVGFGGVVGTTGLLVLLLWPFAPWLMALFGRGFSHSVSPFRCLTLGYVAWAMAVPSLALLTMSGGEKPVALAIWGQLIIALIGGVLFAGRFGATGGAWAWTAGLIVANGYIFVRGLEKVIQEYRDFRRSRA